MLGFDLKKKLRKVTRNLDHAGGLKVMFFVYFRSFLKYRNNISFNWKKAQLFWSR